MIRPIELSDIDPPFLRGYIAAALFSEDPNPGRGEFSSSGRDRELLPRVPQSFLDQAEKDCREFCAQNADTLAGAYAGDYGPESAGMDFWWSRNGHGVGYFDRDLGDAGDALQAAARKWGEVYLEFGGWWEQKYECKCGERWTRPEDADSDPEFGFDTCDACGATVESHNRRFGREYLKDIPKPEATC